MALPYFNLIKRILYVFEVFKKKKKRQKNDAFEPEARNKINLDFLCQL